LKSDAAFGCCGSGILLNRLLESSLILRGFSRLPTRLFALPLALSMEAHYREIDHAGKGVGAIKLQKNAPFQLFIAKHSFYTNLSTDRE
ncbi:hypothetical protein, partial [Aeromonas sanarellii]|uniref:hypothetical protein n=1 Tax=Aeromonas sanarellii TaxID=633415 RepID=UPI003989ACC9